MYCIYQTHISHSQNAIYDLSDHWSKPSCGEFQSKSQPTRYETKLFVSNYLKYEVKKPHATSS